MSHRDKNGILDLKALRAEEKARAQAEEPPRDIWDDYRDRFRLQAVPEYIIESQLKMMRAMQRG